MSQTPDRKYADIARELEEFESYLMGLGVAPLDRIHGAIANIREIELACAEGRAEALEAEPRLPELVWSLVEGQEFAEIYRGIRGYDPAVVKRLMLKAVTGPLDPRLETRSTNVGRNTVFELRLGAGFRLAGTSVDIGGLADLAIDNVGFRLYVECKRPLGEHNIERRVEEASSQLRERFRADSHSNMVGLVAVSASKALNPGQKWLVVEREEDVGPSLTREAERIYKSYCGSIRTEIDLRVVGVICHVFTPVRVRATGRLIAASQYDVFFSDHLRNVLPVTSRALKGLLEQLRAGT